MGTPSQSYGTSLAMWDHLPPETSENTQRNAIQTGWYSIYLPRRDERLSWPSWLDSAPAGSRTSDLVITSPTPNRCATKTTKQNQTKMSAVITVMLNWLILHASYWMSAASIISCVPYICVFVSWFEPKTLYTGWAKKVSLLIFAITWSTASQFS